MGSERAVGKEGWQGQALWAVVRTSISPKSIRKLLKIFKQRDGMNKSVQICIFKKVPWLIGGEWIIQDKSDAGDQLESWDSTQVTGWRIGLRLCWWRQGQADEDKSCLGGRPNRA